MKIISVINYKGGVGKTTLTANLAAELANRDYNVLMIDLDPQASLSFSFVKPDDWKTDLATNKTIKNWFKPSNKKTSKPKFADLIFEPHNVKNHLKGKGKLHLVSSHLELINVDLELATLLSGANLKQAKQNFIKVHKTLADGIEQLRDEYDVILIDCPPNFNIVTKNAIVASDNILIPAKPDYLSTLGIDYLIKSLNELISDFNEYCKVEDDETVDEINPIIIGVLFTMVQFYGGEPISAIRPFISQTKKLKIPVFEAYFRENKTLFADAPQYGVPVVLSNSYRPDIVQEINEFVDEFVNKAL
ncbi:MAG: AAA family ATPase [Bacteroidales bacterium]|jgi:chromosome partitioning protein|nr:AAA family ATPase [Bacteroidales bacterium]